MTGKAVISNVVSTDLIYILKAKIRFTALFALFIFSLLLAIRYLYSVNILKMAR